MTSVAQRYRAKLALSLAEVEEADTKAMGKKAKADLKAVMAVVKQLAKVKPKSPWGECEAFIQRALQNMPG